MQPEQPKRIKLPHDIPSWVADDSKFFITINGLDRSASVLVEGGRAERLIDSIHVYENAKKWNMHIMVVMPDPIHFIATLNPQVGMCSLISSWKGYFSKTLEIQCQQGFFDHRLRNDDEYFLKREYIRMNPVRKGLVEDWKKWPYRWER